MVGLIEYLRLVAIEDTGCWINIHHLYGDGMPGSAHQTFRTIIRECHYWAAHGNDVYMAQGIYVRSAPPTGKKPYHNAVRLETNLSMCRCLYIDMDVKDGAYASQEEALAALDQFVESAALPCPSCLVSSGTGGVHVYWSMVDLFEPKEFRRRAAQLTNAAQSCGLLFDTQCTNDPVRLLRPPETYNFKKSDTGEAGAPVTLISHGDHIQNAAMWDALDKFSDVHKTVTPKSKTVVQPSTIAQKPYDRSGVGSDEFSAGMEKNFALADIDEVAKHCPLIATTLEQAGANLVGEANWHAMCNIAIHCMDGRETAHRLCRGNQYYNEEQTNAKFDSMEKQKTGRSSIGPMRCGTLKFNNQSGPCETCQYLTLNSTPLLVGVKRVNGHSYSVPGDDMPSNYYRGEDNYIYRLVKDDGDDSAKTDPLVFPYQIVPGTAYMENGMPSKLSFQTYEGDNRLVTKKLETRFASDDTTFNRVMLDNTMPITVNVTHARKFMTSYMQKLRGSNQTLASMPAFGWAQDANFEMGFSFNGQYISPNGRERCVRPEEGAEIFRMNGDDKPWRDLAEIIISPDRPDLCCMVASSFGSPLIHVAGEHGVLIGLWSSYSGIGKSTAIQLAQAVWGQPIVGGMNDTVTYTFAKCSQLRHLPVYYDEIIGDDQIASMVTLVGQLTGGREKGRSTRAGEMKVVREFDTGIIFASNFSVMQELRHRNRGTDATMYRIFEMRAIPKRKSERHFISTVSTMTANLRHNFGVIGATYAEYLGTHYPEIKERLTTLSNSMQQRLNAANDQRFWLMAVATTMMGADLANKLGFCRFPIKEMWEYILGEYRYISDETVATSDNYDNINACANAIGSFINEKAPRNLVILNRTWNKIGRPIKGYANVMNDKQDAHWGTLDVQISGQELTLRVTDTALIAWCQKTGRPKASLVKALGDHFSARMTTGTIGSGSIRSGARENCWVMECKNTALEDVLGEYVTNYKMLPP